MIHVCNLSVTGSICISSEAMGVYVKYERLKQGSESVLLKAKISVHNFNLRSNQFVFKNTRTCGVWRPWCSCARLQGWRELLGRRDGYVRL